MMSSALEAPEENRQYTYPEKKFVQVYIHENGHFRYSEYKEDAVINSTVLQGFSLELQALWAAMQDVAPVT